MAPKTSKAPTPLECPLVSQKDVLAAEKKLQEHGELKRQRSSMSAYLKSKGQNLQYSAMPISDRKKFLICFVAQKLETTADKTYHSERELLNTTENDHGYMAHFWATQHREPLTFEIFKTITTYFKDVKN